MTLITAALAITLAITDAKGHPLTVGFAPLKVGTTVSVKGDVPKGELCIISALQGSSCMTLETAGNPKMYRGYLLRESDEFYAAITYWDTDKSKWVTVRTATQAIDVVPQ